MVRSEPYCEIFSHRDAQPRNIPELMTTVKDVVKHFLRGVWDGIWDGIATGVSCLLVSSSLWGIFCALALHDGFVLR